MMRVPGARTVAVNSIVQCSAKAAIAEVRTIAKGAGLRHVGLALAVMLATTGCASAGGSSDQLRSTVYATHRMVQDLSQNLSGTVTQLSGTTAELVARLGTTDQQMRELLSVAQENQYKLEQLQYSLSTLTATLYRHLNLSPPEPAILPSLPGPPGVVPEITRGEILVEPPLGTPQPDTSVTAATSIGADRAALSLEAAAHYREAQRLYADEDYQQALRHFEEHLAKYPDSEHGINSAYWSAHCHFKMCEYPEAIAGFTDLRSQYPDHGKVPIAMYHQAVAYSRLGQNARAVELFQRLIREHPDAVATEGARGALRQLQSLN